MSLEQALNRQSDLLEKHNGLLERLLANSGGAAAAPAATEEKKPATKAAAAKTEEKPKSDAPTFEEVSALATAWIKEHPKGSDEQLARTAYLKSDIYAKLGDDIAKDGLKAMKDNPDALKKFKTWLDGKAKSDLLGYGDGIFAKPAAPEAEGGDDGDEDSL